MAPGKVTPRINMMVNNTYGKVDEKYTTYNDGNLSGWEE